MISMIVAMDNNRGIGIKNGLLWPRLAADMAQFKEHTHAKTVVMGRKTYDSMGRALPGRRNIVLSRSAKNTLPDADVLQGIEPVLKRAKTEDVWVIGGQQIYELFLPFTEELYITQVDAVFPDADTFFPAFEQTWQLIESTPAPNDADVAYEFRKYVLKNKG
jgi:dihydrofolate reductase